MSLREAQPSSFSQLRNLRTLLEPLRNAETGDLHTTFVVNKYARTLNVPVDDLAYVQVIKTFEDLADEVPRERLLERAVVAEKRRH